MTKKRILLLIFSLLALGILTRYALSLKAKKGKSDTDLIDFSIADTARVDKFTITDATGQSITVVRDGKTWTQDNGDCITISNVNYVLEAFKNIEFKGYLPDKSKTTINKLMVSQHIKVEIYQDGEWSKTWYIGPASQDHYGQIMLLDSDEFGKSASPVLMKIKGENGIIEPKFFADPRKWMCTNIFAVPVEKIASVDVQFFDEPIRSFRVNKQGNQMTVFQQNRQLTQVDPQKAYLYLQNYKKIHFELANYELNPLQVDSMKQTQPFCKLKLTETTGKKTTLRLFRIRSANEGRNEFGEIVNMDMNKLWCELPNGELVKCQYYVFNPLLLGHIYFPLDLTQRQPQGKQG